MINSWILKSLTEDETGLLLQVVNNLPTGENPKYSKNILPYLRKNVILTKLEQFKPRIKEEFITGVYEPLVEKLKK